ncbi:hypothetical protein NHQ30_010841 [Ciborinia camelliae]|nr:hypothetical protein NHQ30_010841 [Ciborinia camelliae]
MYIFLGSVKYARETHDYCNYCVSQSLRSQQPGSRRTPASFNDASLQAICVQAGPAPIRMNILSRVLAPLECVMYFVNANAICLKSNTITVRSFPYALPSGSEMAMLKATWCETTRGRVPGSAIFRYYGNRIRSQLRRRITERRSAKEAGKLSHKYRKPEPDREFEADKLYPWRKSTSPFFRVSPIPMTFPYLHGHSIAKHITRIGLDSGFASSSPTSRSPSKHSLNAAVLLFVIFSGACGASQTINQLIIFRAFQGVGGAGTFSLATASLYQLVPGSKLPLYGGITFAVVALATVIGPLVGGVIDTESTWRWIFLIKYVAVASIMGFFIGIPMTVLTIILPQRFQAVNADSPLKAGIHLLAFSLSVPVGSFFANVFAIILKEQPAILFLAAGSALEVIGVGLMTTIPVSKDIPHALYAYEVLAGFGAGSVFSILMLATPKCIDAQDIAVGSSTIIQFRMVGSAIGIAIAGSIVNGFVTSRLSHILTSTQLNMLLQDISLISKLPPTVQDMVREIFGDAYNVFAKVILGLAVAQLIIVGLLWRKPQLPLH